MDKPCPTAKPVIHTLITVNDTKPSQLRILLTGLIIPVGIPLLANAIGSHLGDSDLIILLASMAWTALVAGAGWLSLTILFRFGHNPGGRTLLIGLLCVFALLEGCNRINPSANYHLGDPEDPYENVRGR